MNRDLGSIRSARTSLLAILLLVEIACSQTGPPVTTGGRESAPDSLRVMSLNIYGHATMPDAAPAYASLVDDHEIDVLGIQEGVQDWQIEGLPTDYSRSEALHAALGECWARKYQVFVNTCRGVELLQHRRFDLTDGPNATRTGESALIRVRGLEIAFIDVHWDHESLPARIASVDETAEAAMAFPNHPTIVLGDFNSRCDGEQVRSLGDQADLQLIVSAGIDCILASHADGRGRWIDASPSDHPAVMADLEPKK